MLCAMVVVDCVRRRRAKFIGRLTSCWWFSPSGSRRKPYGIIIEIGKGSKHLLGLRGNEHGGFAVAQMAPLSFLGKYLYSFFLLFIYPVIYRLPFERRKRYKS